MLTVYNLFNLSTTHQSIQTETEKLVNKRYIKYVGVNQQIKKKTYLFQIDYFKLNCTFIVGMESHYHNYDITVLRHHVTVINRSLIYLNYQKIKL